MSENDIIQKVTEAEYEHGFVTAVDQEFFPKGLNEDIIRMISAKKEEPEWMLEFRLKAYNKWLTMKMPQWAHLTIPNIDYQEIIFFSAPKKMKEGGAIDRNCRLLLTNWAFRSTKEIFLQVLLLMLFLTPFR